MSQGASFRVNRLEADEEVNSPIVDWIGCKRILGAALLQQSSVTNRSFLGRHSTLSICCTSSPLHSANILIIISTVLRSCTWNFFISFLS
eukprot:284815509_1